MAGTSLAYRTLARLGTALVPAVSLAAPKLAEGDRGRREAAERLRRWARDARDPSRPLIWIHASSVGEGLQAESVLLELKPLVPHGQYLYTHFSPSAAALARRLPVDVADYLPYDLPASVERLVEALDREVDEARAKVLKKIIDENARQHLNTLNATLDQVQAEAR